MTDDGPRPSATSNRLVHGYCALCTAHCATVATVRGGRVTELEPDHNHPNGGVMCLKGKAAPELVYHKDRLNFPLRRTRPKGDADPGWERVSWETALDDIASRLLEIKKHYGPEAIAMARGTASGTSVDDVNAWSTRLLNAIGSPNTVSTTHVCNWHRDTGFSYTFGVIQPTPDLSQSKAFLLWGHNPSSTSLILAQDIVSARKRGMKVVAVDPRKIGIASRADALLQVRPGADGALALALIHSLIEARLYDETFLRTWTNGPILLRADDGEALTETDLTASGSPSRYVIWDEHSQSARIFDPDSDLAENDKTKAALEGVFSVTLSDGSVVQCRPAFAALTELAQTHAPELSEHVTRVPAQEVRAAAELLGTNRPVSMFMWNGVGQHTNATQTSRAIGILYALLGDIDAPGGNVIAPMAPLSSVDGKEFLSREKAANRIGREEKPLGPPADPGACAAYDIYTAILEQRPYPVRALLNLGSNTIISNGGTQRGREAFCALDLAVATELFMTPTAELCDYVLPATSFLEMDHLTGGFRFRLDARSHVQYRRRAVDPLAERQSDTWFVFELAKRLGLGDQFWGGDITAAREHQLAGTEVTLDQLTQNPGGITVPTQRRFRKYADSDGAGKLKGFGNPSKRVEIYSHRFAKHGFPGLPKYEEPASSPLSAPELAADFPLILTNAKFTTFIHSQQRALPSLRKASPEPSAELHPDTAKAYGIEPKTWMVVESPKGAARVRAHVTQRIIPGVVCIQHGWWQECKELELGGHDPYSGKGANAALLVDAQHRDPISGSLAHRSSLCRIRTMSG